MHSSPPIILSALECTLFLFFLSFSGLENANMWNSHKWETYMGKHIWEMYISPWENIQYILLGFFENPFLKLWYLKIICPWLNQILHLSIYGQFKEPKIQILTWISNISEGNLFRAHQGWTSSKANLIKGKLGSRFDFRPFYTFCCIYDYLWAFIYSSVIEAAHMMGFLVSLQTQNWNFIFLFYSVF